MQHQLIFAKNPISNNFLIRGEEKHWLDIIRETLLLYTIFHSHYCIIK